MGSNIAEAFREYIISRLDCYKMTKANLPVRAELVNACEHLEELIENNGWISVDDGLPTPEQEINYLDDNFEPNKFYLVQLKSGIIDTVYYATICDDCEYNDIFISCTVSAKGNRYYVQERGFDTYAIDEVKYWQYLPKPPQE